MSVSPEPGAAVVVVLRSAEPVQWQGEVVALRDASLAVRLSRPPETWNPMLPYVIICGTPGSRFTAEAHFVARNADVAAFKLVTRWRALDLRKDPRFSTDLKAEVRSVLGNSRQEGRIIDISMGGAAVAVESRPGGSQVEVGISANGYSARLLCDVLSSAQVGNETVMHLRYKDLTPPQAAFIRQLVAALVAAQAKAS